MTTPVVHRCWLSALAILLLSACDGPSGAASEEPVAVARVVVDLAESAASGEQFSVSGTLTAERHSLLSPRVDGLVSSVHVDAGDRVQAGQVLLELDPAVGRQALLRARAGLSEAEAAEREAERLLTEDRRLADQRFIAASQVAVRGSELQIARAAVESARANVREQVELIERHALPAPFTGVVSEKRTEAGEWVQRGTPVLTLVATDRVRLDLRVPQERFGQIDGNAQVQVFADALDGTPLPARVGARVPVTDPGARTFLLRLLVEDPRNRLLPGTSARAEISLAQTGAGAVSISRDALLRQPDGSHSVYVVEDDGGRLVARRRTVRILHEHDGWVAVASDGVSEGERIVVRGNEALGDGRAVDIVER